jgi:hypothetical protein
MSRIMVSSSYNIPLHDSLIPKKLAFHQWYPDPPEPLAGFPLSEGDVVRLTVVTNTATQATITIENITKGTKRSEPLSSPHALCGETAEWFVQADTVNKQLTPLPNFGTVTFHQAVAETVSNEHLEPSGATAVCMARDGMKLTFAHVFQNGVSITYERSQ